MGNSSPEYQYWKSSQELIVVSSTGCDVFKAKLYKQLKIFSVDTPQEMARGGLTKTYTKTKHNQHVC